DIQAQLPTGLSGEIVYDVTKFDLANGCADEFRGVVDYFAGQAGRQLRLDVGHHVAHPLRDVEDVRIRRRLDADEHRQPAAEGDVGVVVLGAEHHGGDILQAHDRAVALLDAELLELFHRMQVGAGG